MFGIYYAHPQNLFGPLFYLIFQNCPFRQNETILEIGPRPVYLIIFYLLSTPRKNFFECK